MKPNIVERLTYEALLSRNSRHFPMADPNFRPAYKNTFGTAPKMRREPDSFDRTFRIKIEIGVGTSMKSI